MYIRTKVEDDEGMMGKWGEGATNNDYCGCTSMSGYVEVIDIVCRNGPLTLCECHHCPSLAEGTPHGVHTGNGCLSGVFG